MFLVSDSLLAFSTLHWSCWKGCLSENDIVMPWSISLKATLSWSWFTGHQRPHSAPPTASGPPAPWPHCSGSQGLMPCGSVGLAAGTGVKVWLILFSALCDITGMSHEWRRWQAHLFLQHICMLSVRKTLCRPSRLPAAPVLALCHLALCHSGDALRGDYSRVSHHFFIDHIIADY